jgi:hypothetical protein
MRHYIPDYWKPLVRAHILETRGEEREHLLSFDFPSGQVVRVDWSDHSFAVFRYAFCLRDEVAQEVAVFTDTVNCYFISTRDNFVVVMELKQ